MYTELEAAFLKARDAAPAGQKAKVQQIYDGAVNGILTAKTKYSKWVDSAAAAWVIQEDALAEFDSLISGWNQQRITTIWVITSGSVGLALVISIVVLILIIRNKNKRFDTLLFDMTNKATKGDKLLSARAEELSRLHEDRRKEVDNAARLAREKAVAFAKHEQRRKEMEAEQEQLKKEREEKLAKHMKLLLEEQKKRDLLDALAQQAKKSENKPTEKPKQEEKPAEETKQEETSAD